MSRNLTIGLVVSLAAVLAIVALWIFVLDDDEPVDVANGDAVNGDAVALGESIYSMQCSGCHTIDGSSGVGPTLQGLYGSEVEMDDGSMVLVDEDHLYEAIVDPRATTRADYPDVMPSFSNLSDEEVSGLVAFIQSLE
jgi:cytochrome c oxidase subunit II